MNPVDVHKFLHDLRNSLNTISINACLIRRLHQDAVEPEILERLETAVRESEQLMSRFQSEVNSEKPA